ncbi:porphobilinogen synthase [bacterium]|nr:porphobilinogen synthase [bacterium]
MYPESNRRIRKSRILRNLTKSVSVDAEKLIQPLFVVEGIAIREPVPGLTGVYRETPESLIRQVEADLEKGVKSFLLFGVPSSKTERNFDTSFNASQIAALKNRFGDRIFLSVDVCLCSSTTHGHCGILNDTRDHVMNAETVEALAHAALAYAKAGADCVAPSDMMDHRIRAIRETLDQNGFHQTLIMSYSAKFHSGFYGPFRVAADSAPKGEMKIRDRATYQIDPANPEDAYRSSLRDMEEGADILMVKPGLPYLDVIRDLSSQIPLPWAVYEVSGEFAAIELMAEKGLVNAPRAHLESWTAFFRAGARMIITYGARFAREWEEKA